MHVRGMGRAASQSSMVGRGRGRINPNHQPAQRGGSNTQMVRYNGGMQQHNMGRGNGTAGRIHPQQQMMTRGRGQQMMARGRGMQPMRGGMQSRERWYEGNIGSTDARTDAGQAR